ncbi:MAG TPA: FAD-dependent monooxygenase [Acetobacteraceae bacterium]|jgi:flavin-dependent dehydrogenase
MQSPLIIGGGPAGAAAAAVIANAGHRVRLIERTAGPTDKVCGDFLSTGAIGVLTALGIGPQTLGAETINTLRLIHRDRVAETRLPFPAMSLTRRTLDEALLQHAASCGAELLRGQAIRRLESTANGFTAHTAEHAAIPASTVFLATGKHDLRGTARPHRGGEPLGLKMYYRLAPAEQQALRGCIELVLFSGGYAGLQMVEHGRAVLCLLTSAERYRRTGADWNELLDSLATEAPHLHRRLNGASACLDRPLAIAGIPYGHLYRPDRATPPELFRLGDQACVIPSFAGDGIAIAVASGQLAATAWLHHRNATDYHRRLLQRVRTPMRVASLFHRGCMMPLLQPVLAGIGRSWPAGMRLVASATRIAPATRFATP